MSTIFQRIGAMRQHLKEFEASGGFRARLDQLREDLHQTQRLLSDGSNFGGMDHLRNIRIWYARLEVEEGSDAATVTASFRRLIRLYHPDLYAADAELADVATELAQHLVTAYNGLLHHLGER